MKLKFLILFGLIALQISSANAAKVSGTAKNQEIVLTSEGGLEWDSNKKTLTAENKALVVRGSTALGADKIIAYYKELPTSKTEVFRVKAFGNVVITTDKQVVYADSATYEIVDSVIVLKGNPVKLMAGQDKMSAKVIELWQEKDVAVAKDNVLAQKDDRRLEADLVRAYFVRNKSNSLEIDRFEAEENVVITNGSEKVQGDFGVYWAKKEKASLEGNVKISQGGNFITGEVADVNLKTGVSRLQTPSEKGKPKKQVKGVFFPDQVERDKSKTKTEKKTQKTASPDILKEKQSGNGQRNNEKLLSSSDEKGE